MYNELITIVLPVYNVENYLDRCISSVASQTYHNLEIILVDDGATDKSPQICDEWTKRDSRIRVIHKQNEGLGMARNTGIINATGSYICFFDSDDYIDACTIEKCLSIAIEDKSEVVTFGFHNVNSQGQVRKTTIPSLEKHNYRNEEIQNFFLPNLIAPNPETGYKSNLWMSACSNLYSMDLIRSSGWRFVSERKYISEDIFSLLELYKNVKSVSIISEPFYFYCDNSSSLTHVYRSDRFEKNIVCMNECIDLCRRLGYSEAVCSRVSYQFVANIIGTIKTIVFTHQKINKYALLKEIMCDKRLHGVLKTMNYRREGLKKIILFDAMKWHLTFIVWLLIRMNGLH